MKFGTASIKNIVNNGKDKNESLATANETAESSPNIKVKRNPDNIVEGEGRHVIADVDRNTKLRMTPIIKKAEGKNNEKNSKKEPPKKISENFFSERGESEEKKTKYALTSVSNAKIPPLTLLYNQV